MNKISDQITYADVKIDICSFLAKSIVKYNFDSQNPTYSKSQRGTA